jgi:branched-chain amino acid transport system permease protein
MLTLQLLVNGLALGAAYALCALGFALIVNATGAVNFAQGDMVMVGGLAAVLLSSFLPVPGLVLLPLVIVLTAALGLAFSVIAYFPLRARPPVSVFISTIAVGIILQNAATAGFGPEPRTGPPLLTAGTIRLGEVFLSVQSVAIVLVAAALFVAQHLLFSRTRLGNELRATAQDRAMAEALGIRVNAMIALTFALATALAGGAGLLLANVFFVTPTDGSNYMLKAYIAATIGGWGSIAGAVAGALLIAAFEVIFPSLPLLSTVFEHAPSWLFSQTSATVILYLALLGILAVRPQGLFGEAAQRRA